MITNQKKKEHQKDMIETSVFVVSLHDDTIFLQGYW